MRMLLLLLLAAAMLPAQAQTADDSRAWPCGPLSRSNGVMYTLTWALIALERTWPDKTDCELLPYVHRLGLPPSDGQIPYASLKAWDFEGLTNMRYLGADSGSSGTTLPDGVFDGLASLEDLSLSHSRSLTTLPASVFDGLTSLERLSLNHSRLTTLPASVFDGLTSLERLNLYVNRLTTLPGGVFDGLTSLGTLDLCANRLTTLPASVFDGLTSLERLNLNNNRLSTLPGGVFDGLTSLEELDLRNNRLVGLTRDDPLFAGLPRGVSIHLDSQADLEDEVFVAVCDRTQQVQAAILEALEARHCAAVDSGSLARVGTLDLQAKGLTFLHAWDFDSLTSLQVLHLNGNRLTTLPSSVYTVEGVFDGPTYCFHRELSTFPVRVFDHLTSLRVLRLDGNQLRALPDVFHGLTSLRVLRLDGNQLGPSLGDGVLDGLTGLQELWLNGNRLNFVHFALPDRVFDDLISLRLLRLDGNQLFELREGMFDGLTSLQDLYLNDNGLWFHWPRTFDGLTNLQSLYLNDNNLGTLWPHMFNDLTNLQNLSLANNLFYYLGSNDLTGLTSLQELDLSHNELSILAADAFEDLTSLRSLSLANNRLWALNYDTFDDPTSLRVLRLDGNRLTTLPVGVFDHLTSLQVLRLDGNRLTNLPDGGFDGLTIPNRLTTLRAGLFDGLTSLRVLRLDGNQLTTLPAGLFDDLTSLQELDLSDNHLVGLTRDDPLFAGLSSGVNVLLGSQTEAPEPTGPPPPVRLAAAVPLMLWASDPMRQGFVRVINESYGSGSVRVFAFDDGGYEPDPLEIRLDARQAVHFNSNDLEYGNPDKGIEGGVGGPVQGDWTLDVETDLAVRALAFVRTTDGFLTAMHDVLPRNDEGRLVAQTFNPGSNMNQESRLRLVNTGATAESVSIEGVDDQGNDAGPVALTLSAGESRTLSAFDLESGAHGLTGTLGDGAGKWRLFVDAGDSVVGVSLLESVSGHLTNISTMGVATDGDTAVRLAAAVPLMLSASDPMRQGFVRIINESEESGSVRVFAFDDGGYPGGDPIEIRLGARQAVHFNSNDLEYGNLDKGIEGGVGGPVQGNWRLDVETDLAVRVLAFIRTTDGFLTAMHDVLPRDDDGRRLVAQTFNPGSNMNQASRLRLVNTGENAERVIIVGNDDQGNVAGPVALTLAARKSRTLSAFELENGADGLIGTLGDGAGKWRLFIQAGDSVVGVSLLESVSGHLTNISTAGVAER